MRKFVYTTVAVLCVATVAIISRAREEDGRIEDVVLTLTQDEQGAIVALLTNGSSGRIAVHTAPHDIEVLPEGTWTVPHYSGFVCGNRDFHQESVAAGGKIKFFVYERLDLVKPGQKFRVSIRALSGFNEGVVVSNALALSKSKSG